MLKQTIGVTSKAQAYALLEYCERNCFDAVYHWKQKKVEVTTGDQRGLEVIYAFIEGTQAIINMIAAEGA